jgi:hypothetical protein
MNEILVEILEDKLGDYRFGFMFDFDTWPIPVFIVSNYRWICDQ